MFFKPLLFGAVFLFFLFLCHVERSRNIQAKPHVWLRRKPTPRGAIPNNKKHSVAGIRKVRFHEIPRLRSE